MAITTSLRRTPSTCCDLHFASANGWNAGMDALDRFIALVIDHSDTNCSLEDLLQLSLLNLEDEVNAGRVG